MKPWTLKKGETILRKQLHKEFGGGGQGGISPSRQSPNIFIFSDRHAGEQHGYLDRWEGDVYLYIGEGQSGDQQMKKGNKAILQHVEDGRSIRLFHGCRGEVEYAGKFEIDHLEPWTTERAVSRSGGMRNVIVFRLREVK
jgi:hypothetical protein